VCPQEKGCHSVNSHTACDAVEVANRGQNRLKPRKESKNSQIHFQEGI